MSRTGVVMIKNLIRRRGETPSSYVPRYTRGHRIKLHHPIWKPNLGTFIDPDLWWPPGCRESCIKPGELEDTTAPTGPGLLRGKSKSSGNPRDWDLSPPTLTVLAFPKASSSGLDCRMMSLTCCYSRKTEVRTT